MQIKFKPEIFQWLKENCRNQSIAAYVNELVDKEIRVSMKGATNESNNKETRSPE